MSPTKLLVQALAVLVVAVPAFAQEAAPIAVDDAMPAAAEQMPGEPAEVTPEAAVESEVAPADLAEAQAPAETAEPAAIWPEPGQAETAEPATSWPEPAQAETAEPAPAETAATPEETLEPLAALPADEPAPPAAPAPAPAPADPVELDTHPPLGAIGYDSEGRRGRIHIVVGGDTLWHISDAYLGTPWVWPSIWNDNGDIENPHLIHPGDRIWITPSEMRRISAEEAAMMLSNLPPEEPPAAPEEYFEPEPEPPAPAIVAEPVERGSLVVSSRESTGLITPSQLQASASIVGRVPERVLLSQEDDVYLGLGESDVEPGDQLTAFRTKEKVFDPDSGVLLGYHVEFLGWLEVKETYPETARAEIRMSNGPLEEGDRLMPREPLPQEISLLASPAGVEGKISFFPQNRVVIGLHDFVYLNRGTIDGLDVGSPLDVYRPGYAAEEVARRDRVLVPDFVIGTMVVVRAEAESAVAMVTLAKTELALGDRFRGADE